VWSPYKLINLIVDIFNLLVDLPPRLLKILLTLGKKRKEKKKKAKIMDLCLPSTTLEDKCLPQLKVENDAIQSTLTIIT
jgi:hypothetical protein